MHRVSIARPAKRWEWVAPVNVQSNGMNEAPASWQGYFFPFVFMLFPPDLLRAVVRDKEENGPYYLSQRNTRAMIAFERQS